MRNLIEFLSRYYHWFLFVALEVVSLVLLFQYNDYQGSVWFTSANYVTGKVYEASSQVNEYFHLREENERLSQENHYLERQVSLLSGKLYDKTNRKDSLRASMRQILNEAHLIPAKVIDNSVTKAENFITLDKGSKDGIHPDMGVVCGTGVVGIVYLVSDHYSVVIPVLNAKSNISCAIEGRGFFGYLRWTEPPSNIAFVDDIPRHAHFKLRDKIVTSGYSSVFPPGLLVGEVIRAFNSKDGLSYRLQVRLSTNFSLLRNVFVIDDASALERVEMIKAAQDSIKPRQQ